ncbi:MAG: M14 metallopeptidase family protein [Mariniblastus sp.]
MPFEMKKYFSLGICVLLIACTSFSTAQETETKSDSKTESVASKAKPTFVWPDGVDFDTAIPTPKQFFGFDIGFRHLTHAQVADYVRKLSESSDRITHDQYATTHGGRPSLMLTITSKSNREKLKKIKQSHRQLTKTNSDKINIDDLPAVINMGYGVHGDEPSATNCAPLVAYYLAAAKGPEVEKWLDSCVILLDPSLNPDGFNRFANWANRYRGKTLNADPQHAEHNQMWPPGRVNYYWFDLNRDWLPLVHPESRGRLNWYHQWKPNVVLDFHEMGTNSSYFFQPGIPERTNPLTPARNQELTRKFAEFHGKALDKIGSLYFTQERFDDFYMGKGSTYPDLHGCVGILFEQASSRGHMQENQDGILHFHQTIENQFTTSLSSLRATTAMRKQLLAFKRQFYKQAFKQAQKQPIKTYVFEAKNNRQRIAEFGNVLRRHDINSYWLKKDLEYGDKTFESEFSLVVPTDQAEFRFLKSLLMRQTDFRENIFYDVSSWTLPLAYDVSQTALKKNVDESLLEPFKIKPPVGESTFEMADDDIAYMVDYRNDAAPWVLARLLDADVKVRVAKKPFQIKDSNDANQSKFGYGTLSVVLGTQKNRKKAISRVLKMGSARGAKITAIKSGLSASGPDLGSTSFAVLEKPKVAMLIGKQMSAYSSGEVWHLLDTQIGMPVTMLKSSSFARSNLSDYTTLILADGSLESTHWSAVEKFVSAGGTVIAIGRLAETADSRLSGAKSESSASTDDGTIQKPFDSASNTRALRLISGAIFKTKIDTTHPLLFGFENSKLAVFRNHARFLSPSSNPYCNPIIYDEQAPLMAGYCSDENVERFKGSASVVVRTSGRGRYILMADNPNFRGFWKATSRVFLNAIYFGELVDP